MVFSGVKTKGCIKSKDLCARSKLEYQFDQSLARHASEGANTSTRASIQQTLLKDMSRVNYEILLFSRTHSITL